MSKAKTYISLICIFLGTIILGHILSPHYSTEESSKDYKRIICMSPNTTEIVFALGAGGRIVGVGDFCEYPPPVKRKENVGGFLNPNFEKILSLKPDLVITSGQHKILSDFCKRESIRCLNMHISNVESIWQAIFKLNHFLQVDDQGIELANTILSKLSQYENKLPKKVPPLKVFLCLAKSPGNFRNIATCGSKSFLNDLLQILQAKNVFEDLENDYIEVSIESLVSRSPDVIIQLSPGLNVSSSKKEEMIKEWGQLNEIKAVQNKKVYLLTGNHLLLPGPRITETLSDLNQCIYGK